MIIVGEKSFKEKKVEFKVRQQEKTQLLSQDEVLQKLKKSEPEF